MFGQRRNGFYNGTNGASSTKIFASFYDTTTQTATSYDFNMEKLQCDKTPFTKKDAKTKMNLLISSGSWNKKQGSGRVYHCPICKNWHLTSKLDTEPIENYNKFKDLELKHTDEFLKLMFI